MVGKVGPDGGRGSDLSGFDGTSDNRNKPTGCQTTNDGYRMVVGNLRLRLVTTNLVELSQKPVRGTSVRDW